MISTALYVEGQVIGASYEFEARVFVSDPGWRRATAGEVHVELREILVLLPDRLLDEKETDANGDCRFNTLAKYPPGEYILEAKHNRSGSSHQVRIFCHDDGSFDIQPVT